MRGIGKWSEWAWKGSAPIATEVREAEPEELLKKGDTAGMAQFSLFWISPKGGSFQGWLSNAGSFSCISPTVIGQKLGFKHPGRFGIGTLWQETKTPFEPLLNLPHALHPGNITI
jgi:hypothetical protein